MSEATRLTARLPGQPTGFVGRRAEIAEVRRLLRESRLVTLTGFGGLGKTRLAVEVARQQRRSFADGVAFVDLTLLPAPEDPEPDAVAGFIAAVLGLLQGGPDGSLARLVDQLATSQSMLLLDNCEHVLLPVRNVVDEVLARCPGVRILATSREAIGAAGEAVFGVPSLLLGDDESGRPSGAHDAVSLFEARGRAARAGFRVTEENAAAVAKICRLLEGLPLALELTASLLRAMTPEQIATRLERRLSSAPARRGGPERHRTLQASADWSHDLCTKPERLLWARASVFFGGFERDALEAVCTDDRLPPEAIDGALAGLVQKSVVAQENVTDGVRYRLLEVLREYGMERLADLGEQAAASRRQLDWCLSLTATARVEWSSGRQLYWMGRLEREIPNLRAAVDYCLMTPSQAESALRLAVSLPSMFWLLNGQLGEARRWLAPAREPGLPSPERAAALVIGSYLAFAQGDLQEGASMLVDGSTMAERLADPAAQVLAAHFRSVGRFFADSVEEGVDDLRSALELLDSLPLETELDLHVLLLSDLLVTCSISGEFELGLRCRERVLAATASFPDSFDRGYGIWAAAMLDERIGELDRAADEIAEAVRIKLIWLGSDAVGLAIVIEEAAVIAGRRSEHTLAATILGFADVFWTTLDADRNAHHHLQRLHVACERAAREALGDAAFLRAYDQGRAMSPAQIGALLAGRPAPAAPQPGPSLTAREQETAALLAAGLTNREIAARLFISTRTAEGHVQRLMAKLGVTRREDVARALGRPE